MPLGLGAFAVLAAALFLVAAATLIPAAGALRIAPMQVLRQD